jgi:hypothetical protein
LNRYLTVAADRNATPDAIMFCRNRRDVFSKLAALAEDVIVASASQTFVERIFSKCGVLTTGLRNLMKRSLEMQAFLKLSANIV